MRRDAECGAAEQESEIRKKMSTTENDHHSQSLTMEASDNNSHHRRQSLPLQIVRGFSGVVRSSSAVQLIQTVTEGVSKSKHKTRTFLLFLFSVTVSTVLGGLIYGFTALRSNLLNEEDSTLSEEELGLIFTVGTVMQLVAALLFGLLRDKFGTRNSVTLSIFGAFWLWFSRSCILQSKQCLAAECLTGSDGIWIGRPDLCFPSCRAI